MQSRKITLTTTGWTRILTSDSGLAFWSNPSGKFAVYQFRDVDAAPDVADTLGDPLPPNSIRGRAADVTGFVFGRSVDRASLDIMVTE